MPVETVYFTQCVASWSPDTDTKYFIVKMVFLYVTPLAFMSVTYFHIIRVLWKSGNENQQAVGKFKLFLFLLTSKYVLKDITQSFISIFNK